VKTLSQNVGEKLLVEISNLECNASLILFLRWPRLTKVVEHDDKNWLQRVQHQISVERELNKMVKQMAKESCSEYQPTLESLEASLSIGEPFEVVEDSLSKKTYKRYP
jgi:hypothetical protein